MRTRLQFSELLHTLTNNCYFNPPEGIKIKFPCIIYELYKIDNKAADNINYIQTAEYKVTVADSDPDSQLMLDVLALPGSRIVTSYNSNGIHHTVFYVNY